VAVANWRLVGGGDAEPFLIPPGRDHRGGDLLPARLQPEDFHEVAGALVPVHLDDRGQLPGVRLHHGVEHGLTEWGERTVDQGQVDEPVPVRAVPAPPGLHVVPELRVAVQLPQAGFIDLVQELADLHTVPGLQPPETLLVLRPGRFNARLQGLQPFAGAQLHLGAGRRLYGQMSAPTACRQAGRQNVPEAVAGLCCCLAHRATTSKTSRAIRSMSEPCRVRIGCLKMCAGPLSALEYLKREASTGYPAACSLASS